jgi:hypothetical protein
MLRNFHRSGILSTALLCSSFGWSDPAPAVRLPPGTRAEADHYASGRGLRETTDFLAKQLNQLGIAATQIGPYRVRGVELTRFLSHAPSTSWQAIHVSRIAGKTLISFVPRSKP